MTISLVAWIIVCGIMAIMALLHLPGGANLLCSALFSILALVPLAYWLAVLFGGGVVTGIIFGALLIGLPVGFIVMLVLDG